MTSIFTSQSDFGKDFLPRLFTDKNSHLLLEWFGDLRIAQGFGISPATLFPIFGVFPSVIKPKWVDNHFTYFRLHVSVRKIIERITCKSWFLTLNSSLKICVSELNGECSVYPPNSLSASWILFLRSHGNRAG